MKTLVIALLLASAAFAQTAKVVSLSPADAAKAKQLHEAVKEAQKAQEKFDDEVIKRYIRTTQRVSDGVEYFTLEPGWKNGFEYSEDFLFIVPSLKPSPFNLAAPDYTRYGGIETHPNSDDAVARQCINGCKIPSFVPQNDGPQ